MLKYYVRLLAFFNDSFCFIPTFIFAVEVLVEQEDTNNLLKDLRSKMIERINALESSAQDNVKVHISLI